MTSVDRSVDAGGLPRPTALAPGAGAPIAALLVAVFLTTVALPLATYTTVLALFGLAHVGSELRYIDYRYGPRLRGGLGIWLATPIVGAVAARIAGITHVLSATPAVAIELSFGAAMTAICIACMRQNRPVAVVASLALFSGAAVVPFETLLVLAIAHNFTPVAFLADALHGTARKRVLAWLTIPFFILPLLIASGLPYGALMQFGLVAPDVALLRSGGLDANLGVYVPAGLVNSDWALHIFAAAVFAQCMHYVVVIGVLPRLIDPNARAIFSWPRPRRFAVYLVGAAGILALGFTIDFKVARQVYGLFAMVHSWIEIPILILALDRGGCALQTSRRA